MFLSSGQQERPQAVTLEIGHLILTEGLAIGGLFYAALVEDAATLAANLVTKAEDIKSALHRITSIHSSNGVLIVKDGHVDLAGKLPPLSKKCRHEM